MRAQLESMTQVIDEVGRSNHPAFGETAQRLREAVAALETATDYMLAHVKDQPQQALAGATPYLRLFGVTQGGVALAKRGLVAAQAGDGEAEIVLARFFAAHVTSEAQGLGRTVTDGAEALAAGFAALAS